MHDAVSPSVEPDMRSLLALIAGPHCWASLLAFIVIVAVGIMICYNEQVGFPVGFADKSAIG